MNWFTQSIECKIIAAITIGIAVVAAVSMTYLIRIEKDHNEEMLIAQSRVMFNYIQLTRSWNARHGGVYVIMKAGDKTNPYLYEVSPGEGKPPAIKPEIKADDGERLTMKNPAMMTREIAELADDKTTFRFHLTSLKLINPDNTPDAFEKASLEIFQQEGDERYLYEEIDGKSYFRYMAPLLISDACLNCHGFQGYKAGDIRGGISISFPVNEMDNGLLAGLTNASLLSLIAIYITVILLLSYFIRMLVTGPVKRLVLFSLNLGGHDIDDSILVKNQDEVGQLARSMIVANRRIVDQQNELTCMNKKLEEQARRDSLTTLHNRRHLMLESGQWFAKAKRSESSITTLMVDIDHFKEINDRYGHATGDEALKHVSEILKSMVREYDMLVRFGGEEFLILLPDTGHSEAMTLAERIRKAFEKTPFQSGKLALKLTVSIGLYTDIDCNLETAIAESDKALYRAKNEGRNRVVSKDQE